MSTPALTEVVSGLFNQYGLLALFGIFLLEGAMLLYFAPSESLVPGAIVLLTEQTVAEIAAVIAIATVGATIGQTALFVLVDREGRDRVVNSRWFRFSESKLERFDRWFDRWGLVVVVVSNALPFTRGMCTIPAGFSKLSSARFAVASAMGTILFESALAALALGILGFL